MRLIKLIPVLFSLLVLQACTGVVVRHTQVPPPDRSLKWNIVCFERHSLTTVLDTIHNAQQFHMNDPWQTIGQRDFNRLGCSYEQIPRGSRAYQVGLHSTSHGFSFPILKVRFSTNGQVMYTANEIYLHREHNNRDRNHRR